MTSFAAAPPLLGSSVQLCSPQRRRLGGPATPRYSATKASCRAVAPSGTAGPGFICRPGLRRGRCLLTRCSGAGRPGELYACADREPLATGVPSSFPESFYGVKVHRTHHVCIATLLSNRASSGPVDGVNRTGRQRVLERPDGGHGGRVGRVRRGCERSERVGRCQLRGKSVPFMRGRTVYEYSRGPEGDQLAFRNVRVMMEPWFNQRDLHLVIPEIVSWAPRISLYRNFLTPEECNYLIEVAGPNLESSLVVSKENPQGYLNSVRTSYGMFLGAHEQPNPIVQAIEKRIAVFTQIPKENGECIQVIRYEKGQHFTPHYDYFSNESGNDRIATMLMYLNDDFEGGETYFPKVGDGECFCGGLVQNGWSIKPRRGDAVFFWSLGLDGEMDLDTLHAGCDVMNGEKWVAIKWLHGKKYSD